jgi:UDP-N-acetylglucosamine acyltransferase
MPSRTLIHPTAIVAPSAELARDVEVGPYAIIEAGVVIGEGSRVGGHAVIGRDTRLGRNNTIHHHAAIGTPSQDLKHKGEKSFLVVGDNNIFREFVTVNRATGEGKATRVGNGCALMAYAHVAHNSVLEDGVVLANCAELGGEVHVEERATVAGLVGVHQFCRIGAFAFVGACSKVTQDILPFVIADGHPARPYGLNLVGLRRHGFSSEAISALKSAYRCLFCRGMLLERALDALAAEHAVSPEVQRIVHFIRASSRRYKIARPRAHPAEPTEDLEE